MSRTSDPTTSKGPKVISIVDRLEARQTERLRKLSNEMHLRELEAQVEWLDFKKSIESTDTEAAIADAPDDRTRAELRCVRGLQKCFAGDIEGGHADWTAVIADTPDLALPHICIARWAMQTDPHAALPHFDRAAIVAPHDPTAYARRGDCYVRTGDHERAIANYRRALSIDPTTVDCLYALGKSLVAVGKVEEAVRSYDQAIARAPRYVDFYTQRAIANLVLDHFDAVLRDVDAALELDPSRTPMLFLRAKAYVGQGDHARALETLEMLDAKEPNLPGVLLELGKVFVAKKEASRAIEILTRAIELRPDGAEGYYHRACAHIGAEAHESAIGDLRRASELDPKNIEAATLLVCIEGRAQPRSVQIAAVDEVLSRFPDFPILLERRGNLLFEEGEHARALADFDKLVAWDANEAAYYVGRAKARCATHDVKGALDDADRAIFLDPGHGLAHAMRAAYRSALEENDALVDADYLRGTELAPKDPSIRHYYAAWLKDAGRYMAAVEQLDRLIEILPRRAEAYADRAWLRTQFEDEWYDANPDWDEDDEGDDARRTRYEAALADVERALALGREDEELVATHYWILRELEGVEAAAVVLTRGLERFPDNVYFLRLRSSARREMQDVAGAEADQARAEAIQPSPQ